MGAGIRDNTEDFSQPHIREDRKKIFKGVEVEDDFKVMNKKKNEFWFYPD